MKEEFFYCDLCGELLTHDNKGVAFCIERDGLEGEIVYKKSIERDLDLSDKHVCESCTISLAVLFKCKHKTG